MAQLRRTIATSDHWAARAARSARKAALEFSVPAPPVLTKPLLHGFLSARTVYHEAVRLFFCEPLTKAYCTSHGRNLHTSTLLPWIQGSGDIVLGDNVTISGGIAISFACHYNDRPLLKVGNNSGLSHGCRLVIAKEIRIGDHVRIGQGVVIRDANGHASEPDARMRGEPAPADEVRPVVIEDNVWIGAGVNIGPGITIGKGSIISAQSVVMSNVPPYSIFAGFPARKVGSLPIPGGANADSSGATRAKVESD
jgi:acetyltransferase-like isoleucine patch superfamily enzyme